MTSQGVNFTVKVDKAEDIGRAMLRLQLHMRDMRPMLKEIGASLLTSTQRRFEDEQGPDGTPWPSTQRGGHILRESGRLYQSLTYAVGAGQVEVGTNTVYARIHQLGGRAGRGRKVTIKPRPFLGLDTEDRREVMDIVNDYIREVLP